MLSQSKDSEQRFLTIGQVVKPQGLKGEICILSYADSPFIFDVLDTVFLKRKKSRAVPFALISWRRHKKKIFLTLEGIQSRNEAETWKSSDILVRYADIPSSGPEELLWADLIQRTVFLKDGRRLGILSHIQSNNGQEVWTIRTGKDQEILFPAAEVFIHRCDPESDEVWIDPPPGLLDIYLNPGENP